MCLYPRLMINKKYQANKKNGGIVPYISDERIKYVPIGCQQCIECKKQKARQWQVRLLEDIKTHTNGKYITLTFNNKSFKEIDSEIKDLQGYDRDNATATLAMRRFLERWRKEFKTSLRHWFVTEIGGHGTENIHMHGIVWTDKPLTILEEKWSYGFVWKGQGEKQINYVNEKTTSYITKYVNKVDEKHPGYKSKILTSPGIGHNYTETNTDSKKNQFNNQNIIDTNETYKTRTGHKISLPIYWRNKIYSKTEREKLWINKIDKQIRWVRGEKIDISTPQGEKNYEKILKWHQQLNEELGYGNNKKSWKEEEYQIQRRWLNRNTRVAKAQEQQESPRRRGNLT